MKEKLRFQIGSKYFFNEFKDYSSKDNDILIIMDSWKLSNTNVLNLKDKNGDDIFFYKDLDKENFIKDTLESNVPMKCGKFLIKEFCEYINFTIEDLKILETLFNKLDHKHQYEKKIYEFYIENNSFNLTKEQLKECYKIYKKRET